jgi:hypothetical protein
MPLRKLHRDIETLDELCAGVLRDPEDKALADRLVRELAAEQSPLKETGRGKALDTALARASFIFASWRPLIDKGSVNASAWAGELRTALFNVKSELEIVRRLLGL